MRQHLFAIFSQQCFCYLFYFRKKAYFNKPFAKKGSPSKSSFGRYLSHCLFGTLCEMQGYKAGKCGMVRGRLSFQKVHEIDVPAACSLDIPAGIDMVHAGVDHNLGQLPGRRLIFLYLSIGLIKIAEFHSLHKCTQEPNRIICRD